MQPPRTADGLMCCVCSAARVTPTEHLIYCLSITLQSAEAVNHLAAAAATAGDCIYEAIDGDRCFFTAGPAASAKSTLPMRGAVGPPTPVPPLSTAPPARYECSAALATAIQNTNLQALSPAVALLHEIWAWQLQPSEIHCQPYTRWGLCLYGALIAVLDFRQMKQSKGVSYVNIQLYTASRTLSITHARLLTQSAHSHNKRSSTNVAVVIRAGYCDGLEISS